MKPASASDNPILRLSFEFSLLVLAYVEELEKVRRYVIAQQLLRSGTSIGANVREAQHAESRADFTHKCKVAAKEASETEYCCCSASKPQTTPIRRPKCWASSPK